MSARETGEVAVSPDGASADLSFALSTRPSWEAAAPAPKMAEAPRPYYAAAPPPLRPSSPVPSPPPPAAPVYQEEPTKYDLAGNPIASATSPPAAPKGMSQYLTGLLATKGNIEIRLNASVVAVHGDRHLEAITVEDAAAHTQERIETESLFVFIGADARTEWLPCRIARDDRNSLLTGLEAQSSGKWILDRDPYLLETSVPGVLRRGTCVTARSSASPRARARAAWRSPSSTSSWRFREPPAAIREISPGRKMPLKQMPSSQSAPLIECASYKAMDAESAAVGDAGQSQKEVSSE